MNGCFCLENGLLLVQDKTLRDFLLTNLELDFHTKKYRWRVNLEAIENAIEEIGDMALPSGSTFVKPTKFIGGEDSGYISTAINGSLPSFVTDHFPSATVQWIPKAGHWVHWEQPALFQNSVVDFFESSQQA